MAFNSPHKLTPGAYAHEALAGTVAAPTATQKGWHTRNHEKLHLAVENVGTSIDIALYVRYPESAEWFLLVDFGTAGTRQFTTDAYVVVDISGAEYVFPAVPALVGGTPNVWIGANSAKNE